MPKWDQLPKLIANFKKRISLYNLDAAEFILTVLPGLPQRTLVYLDPPYYVKGKELYENYYGPDDHAKLAKMVKKGIRRQKWIVSYDNVPQIFQLYKGYQFVTYRPNYFAQNRYRGSEVIFFCKDLLIPDVSNPTKVDRAQWSTVYPLSP